MFSCLDKLMFHERKRNVCVKINVLLLVKLDILLKLPQKYLWVVFGTKSARFYIFLYLLKGHREAWRPYSTWLKFEPQIVCIQIQIYVVLFVLIQP